MFDLQQVFVSADTAGRIFRKPPRLVKSARYKSNDGHVAVKDILQVKNGSRHGKCIKLASLSMVEASSASDMSHQSGTHL